MVARKSQSQSQQMCGEMLRSPSDRLVYLFGLEFRAGKFVHNAVQNQSPLLTDRLAALSLAVIASSTHIPYTPSAVCEPFSSVNR